MCEGIKILANYTGAGFVTGFDIDPELLKINPNILIKKSLSDFSAGSYDVVVCCDVIEHVVDDVALFNDLLRIARKKVYITTPNYVRSKARNRCHCREYTIAQFCNTFRPDELMVASPDGRLHMTKLLVRVGDFYQEEFNGVGDNPLLIPIPENYRFNRTVDGEEWPHYCGVFFA